MFRVSLLLLVMLQSVGGAPKAGPATRLQYERVIEVSGRGEACAVLDAEIFPHAAPSLKDLRIFAKDEEIPYALTLSGPTQVEVDRAVVMNLVQRGREVTFDLRMPRRAYTEVTLELAGKDFVADAVVSGVDVGGARKELGSFRMFDLTMRGLGRQTTMDLQESRFGTLHVEMRVVGLPGWSFVSSSGWVTGAVVPPSRSRQTVYSAVGVGGVGGDGVAHFRLEARVPVERVRVEVDPRFNGDFSRRVRVRARADAAGSPVEEVEGTVTRVRTKVEGEDVAAETMSFPASLGANLQEGATVEVAVEGGGMPLLITSVVLEMRERKICFDAPSFPVALFYGDAGLAAPSYAYARTFRPSDRVLPGTLGPEVRNSAYRTGEDGASGGLLRQPWTVKFLLGFSLLALSAMIWRERKHAHFKL